MTEETEQSGVTNNVMGVDHAGIATTDADELANLDPGFEPLAEDFVGLQVQAIEVNPEIPVHEGLAEFLKEHDAWNDDWEIAE